MRRSEFWTLVADEFGRARGELLVRDHVLRQLGNRTSSQALEDREDERRVWLALCEDLAVPEERRLGRGDPAPSARARRPRAR